MATIQPGTDGTFKSTTAEGRLIEAACFLRLQEADSTRNPNGLSAVIGDFSINSNEFSGSYSLACTQGLSASGSLSIVAKNYLVGVPFSPGTGTPTFKSTTIEAYLLEIIGYLQFLEADSTKNPNSLNQITGTYNADTEVYSGSFAIPVSIDVGIDGSVKFAAVEYLTT